MKISATDLRVGDVLIDEEQDDLFPVPARDRVASVTPGNGIVRWTSEHGSGYFDETSTVDVER